MEEAIVVAAVLSEARVLHAAQEQRGEAKPLWEQLLC